MSKGEPVPRSEKLVHIIPVPGVHIVGVPAKEQGVSEAEWQRLSEFKPPAFTKKALPKEDQDPKEGNQ